MRPAPSDDLELAPDRAWAWVALPGLELTHVVERPSKAFASYSWVIRAVAVAAGFTFAVGAVYAFWFAS